MFFSVLHKLTERALASRTLESPEIDARGRIIIWAFERAFNSLPGAKPLLGRAATMEDARLAVKASHYHCGPLARSAGKFVANAGLNEVQFHSVGFHYVLLDQITGLMYDIETLQGCARSTNLLVWSRIEDLTHTTPENFEKIFEKYARIWFSAKNKLVMGDDNHG